MSEQLTVNVLESTSIKALEDFIASHDNDDLDFETFANLCATVAEEYELTPEDMTVLIGDIRAEYAQDSQS